MIAAVYEWHRASELETELHALREQRATSSEQLERSQREHDRASEQVARLSDENESLKNQSSGLSRLREEVAQLKAATQDDVTQSAAKSWLERMTQLKQHMGQTPGAKIPELEFVTEQDWLDAAKKDLKTDVDYRRALSAIRAAGEARFVTRAKNALKKYAQANGEEFPTDLGKLKVYFDPPVDDAILQRWTVLPADAVSSFRLGGEVVITQREPVDDVFDTQFVLGESGGSGSTEFFWSLNGELLQSVYEAYAAVHNGQRPDDASQLQPYVTTPEQRAALEKLILRQSVLKDR